MADETLSTYAALEILDWITGVANPADISAGRYLALATTRPTVAGTFTELSGNNYSRVDLSGKFVAATTPTVSNSASITTPAASGDWVAFNYWVIMDAATSGTMVGWGRCPETTVFSGGTATFPVGSIRLKQR